MLQVRRTEVYARWLDGLRDVRARARVLVRVERLAAGNPGDVRPVGEGVSELRIDYGPGYRVYFKRQGRTVVILLAGGDKRSQSDDIETALRPGAKPVGEHHDQDRYFTLRRRRAPSHSRGDGSVSGGVHRGGRRRRGVRRQGARRHRSCAGHGAGGKRCRGCPARASIKRFRETAIRLSTPFSGSSAHWA